MRLTAILLTVGLALFILTAFTLVVAGPELADVVASLAFRFYVMNSSSYQESYGAIGSVVVLMLWFYLSGLVLIVAAEMSAEIEHASPWAKNPGEKVPGQKKITEMKRALRSSPDATA